MLTEHPPPHPTPHAIGPTRVLCVLDKHPLPADNGSRQRLWNLVRGIAARANGTAVVLGGDTEPDRVDALAKELPGWRVVALPRDPARRPIGQAFRDVGTARLPVHLARRDLSGWRAAIARELTAGYDAVFVSHPRPFVLVEELTDLPIIATIDDLEHLKPARGRPAGQRRARDTVIDAADLRAWPRLYTRICQRAAVVLVCSPADRDALPGGRVMVVPNGADIPARLPRRVRHEHPTVLFHGQMTDPSNVDGAVFLTEQVIDEIRRRVPDARVRIVGRAGPEVIALRERHDAVDIIGYVDDMRPELGRADVAIVPLRIGSGTRLSILEAFAHGLPVVTTSVGLDGIDATPGRHALVADDAAGLAAAATAVLRDVSLQDALRAEGRRLVKERYDWAIIRHCVGEVVDGVTDRARHERTLTGTTTTRGRTRRAPA